MDLEDDRGWTPLAYASRNGHRQIVKMLLAFGADPGHKCTHGTEALAIACRGGYVNIASLLLEKSANVNATARAGITALHHAAHCGYCNFVQLLLDEGADIDATNETGATALLYASRSGPWFNIKMTSYQFRKSHCGDKTILRPSYLHNGISFTGKMTYIYIESGPRSSWNGFPLFRELM